MATASGGVTKAAVAAISHAVRLDDGLSTERHPMRLAAPSARVFAVALATLFLGATLAPEDADARAGRGGGFGSRGSRTYSAPPPTATAPGAAPIERSMTQPGRPGQSAGGPAAAASPASRPGGLFGGLGGGLGAGIMGGLLGAGIFGLLSGSGMFGGLGSMSSLLGLVIQFGIIFLVAKLVIGWWRRRQSPQPASAAAGSGPSGYQFDRQSAGGSKDSRYGIPGLGSAAGSSYGGAATSPQGDATIEPEDFDAFERLLSDVQEAWTKQDLSRLRGLATPEMVEIFGEDLAEDASRGVVNKVSGVKLLQGDLAESWSEGGRDFATVAMRYELVDVTEDRETGRLVEGDATASTEVTELWTFLRAKGGRWLLTAIQQAR